jgi:hypothetical protein
MTADRYHISSSKAAKEQFRQAIAMARENGQFALAVRAAEWMLDELARTPIEFGESRANLPALELQMRLAFVRPLAVQFAVHEEKRMVFVQGFRYCI